jgi:hypothetical protein
MKEAIKYSFYFPYPFWTCLHPMNSVCYYIKIIWNYPVSFMKVPHTVPVLQFHWRTFFSLLFAQLRNLWGHVNPQRVSMVCLWIHKSHTYITWPSISWKKLYVCLWDHKSHTHIIYSHVNPKISIVCQWSHKSHTFIMWTCKSPNELYGLPMES